MTDASTQLLDLARRTAGPYTRLPGVRAVMVTGSSAGSYADFYSDLDMTAYYDELPGEAELAAAREEAGGGSRIWLIGDRAEGSIAEAFEREGVQVQIGHATRATWERDMASVLEQFDTSPLLHKAVSGVQICVPLHGAELISSWQDRLAAFPDGLARALVQRYLQVFPLWGLRDYLAGRDATMWCTQSLVEAAQNLLGVLAGLNRRYYSTFQFKRARQFIATLPIAPVDLYERLEGLFGGDPLAASPALEQLVAETAALVETHMPEVDPTPLRARVGWRHRPWNQELRTENQESAA